MSWQDAKSGAGGGGTPPVQVQSDFLETDTMSPAYILNRDRNALEKTDMPLQAGAIIVADVGGLLEESSIMEDATDLTASKPFHAPNIAGEAVSTSLIEGGLVTEDTTTTVNISAGSGRIVTIDGMGMATVIPVSWSEMLAVPIIDILTTKSTRFVIDASGDEVQLTFELTPETARNYINLGFVIHPSGTIGGISNDGLKAQSIYSQLLDHLESLGVVRKSGLAITHYAGLSLDKSAGILESPGAGVGSGNVGQNIVEISADIAGATFTRFLQDGTVETAATVDLDPGFYDDGGVKTAMPQPNDAQIVYVYQAIDEETTNGLFIAYGQTAYTSVSDAEINAATDTRVIPTSIEQRTNLLARIIVRSNATTLGDPNQAVFLPGAKFGVDITGGSLAAGSGGGDVSGPASSQLNEIPSYAGTSGKVIEATSDVSILDGAIERITPTEDLWLKTSATSENVIIGRHTDLSGIPSLTNTTLVVTASGTNAIALVSTSNNSASIDFVKVGIFRGKLNFNRDRNSLGIVNATGAYIEVRPDDNIVSTGKVIFGGTSSPRGVIQANSRISDAGGFTDDVDCPMVANILTDNGGDTLADPLSALILMRSGIDGESYGNAARFDLSRYENDATKSKTQLDIRLSDNALNSENNDTPVIMSLRSNGDILDLNGNNMLKQGCVFNTFQNITPTLPIMPDSYVTVNLGSPSLGNAVNFSQFDSKSIEFDGNEMYANVTMSFDYHVGVGDPENPVVKGYAFAIGRNSSPITGSIHENNAVIDNGHYHRATIESKIHLVNAQTIQLRVKQYEGAFGGDITIRNFTLTVA